LGAAGSRMELNFHKIDDMQDSTCFFVPAAGAIRTITCYNAWSLMKELNSLNRYTYADVSVNSDTYHDMMDYVSDLNEDIAVYLDGEEIRKAASPF